MYSGFQNTVKLKSKVLFISFFILLISVSFCFGAGKKLTFRQVFLNKGERVFRSLPHIEKWKDKNHFIQFVIKKKGGKTLKITELVEALSGEKTVISDDVPGKNFPDDMNFNDYIKKTDKGRRYLFLRKGDLFLYDLNSDDFRQLTFNPGEKKNPEFSPDGRYIAYTMNRDLYIVNTETKKTKRITYDGSSEIFNGWASWIYYEEILGRRSGYRAFWWSPDSRKIVFFRFDNSKVPEFTLVSSKGVHGETEVTSYPKAGDPSPLVSVKVYHLKGRTVVVDKKGDGDVFYAKPKWLPDSSAFILQKKNRQQDHLTLYNVNCDSGKRYILHEERQNSWVDFYGKLLILKKRKGFLIISDIDGWRHIYHYGFDGKLKKRLTKGRWSVRSIEKIDESRGYVCFSGTKSGSSENHLYRVSFKGGKVKKLSSGRGYHYFKISPGCKYFIDTFSNINHPSVMELYRTDGKFIRRIADSRCKVSENYKFGKSELFTIPSDDGYNLPAIWTLPPDFDRSEKYPVMFRIYGGPGYANVRDSYRRLSDFYFAQNGIIVFTVDHRGSGHFGKKGVARMHRNLGKWEMHDYIAAVKWLRKKSFVNPLKIAITGGSYGGYVTALAMTRGADYFTHGIASYSVTDWKLYDSFYTEKYMDKPDENSEGYRKASVLEYADALKGKILIVHGTMDDNVHMQNSLQLISILQDLNKDFSVMFYPGGRHGWRGKKRDHYSKLKVRFWFRNLLGKEFDINRD